MRKTTSIIFFLFIINNLFSSVLVVEGTYQLRNLFILNPTASAGVGNCVYEITVNDEIAPDEISPNAFEVDLSIYGLKIGDPVLIKISHREGCEPKVLNPGALKPNSSFDVTKIEVSENGLLSWTTTNESGQLPFIVQQKKWNKWVNVGEVMGEGDPGQNNYQYKVDPVSGTNEFRVIQKSFDGKIRKSEPVTFESNKAPVSFEYNKKEETLVFTDETSFEIYDVYGQIVKRGFNKSVVVNNLDKGKYYITFDNTTDEFDKK